MLGQVDLGSPRMVEAELDRPAIERMIAAVGDTPLDLADRSLNRLDLSGLDLRSADLRWARLNGARLVGRPAGPCQPRSRLGGRRRPHRRHLSEADLFQAQLGRARLDRADLSRARLVTNLDGA